MYALEVSRLTHNFSGVRALDDVSLRVEPARIQAIIGPNGAGKTTLFNVISGFILPDSGDVKVDGNSVKGLKPYSIARQGIVRTFQLVRPFRDMTVEDNVAVGAHLQTRGGFWSALARPRWGRLQERQIKDKAAELLQLVGLSHCAGTLAGALTYGQTRLLEIARALAAGPRILLLDEPAAGLNRAETDELAKVLRTIAGHGTGVLLIEHDMNFVMNAADHIAVLDFGRKIAEGNAGEIRRHPDVITAYLGQS
jgi:branched-chain amino acid transport system ATP-binding protein